jgi:hypothetical protein
LKEQTSKHHDPALRETHDRRRDTPVGSLGERRRKCMANKLRRRLGKHEWRSRGRGDALTYVCQDKPPRGRSSRPEGGRLGHPPRSSRTINVAAQCRCEAQGTLVRAPTSGLIVGRTAVARRRFAFASTEQCGRASASSWPPGEVAQSGCAEHALCAVEAIGSQQLSHPRPVPAATRANAP